MVGESRGHSPSPLWASSGVSCLTNNFLGKSVEKMNNTNLEKPKLETYLSTKQRESAIFWVTNGRQCEIMNIDVLEKEKNIFIRESVQLSSYDRKTYTKRLINDWWERKGAYLDWQKKMADLQVEFRKLGTEFDKKWQDELNKKFNSPYLDDFPDYPVSAEKRDTFNDYWKNQFCRCGIDEIDWALVKGEDGQPWRGIHDDLIYVVFFNDGLVECSWSLNWYLYKKYEALVKTIVQENLPRASDCNAEYDAELCEEMIKFLSEKLSLFEKISEPDESIESDPRKSSSLTAGKVSKKRNIDGPIAGFDDEEYRAITVNLFEYFNTPPTEEMIKHFINAFTGKSKIEPMVWKYEKTKRTPRILFSLYDLLRRLGYLNINQSEIKKLIIQNFVDADGEAFGNLDNPFSKTKGLKEKIREEINHILKNSLIDQKRYNLCYTLMEN